MLRNFSCNSIDYFSILQPSLDINLSGAFNYNSIWQNNKNNKTSYHHLEKKKNKNNEMIWPKSTNSLSFLNLHPVFVSNYIFVHNVNAVKTRFKQKPLKESYWILAQNPDRETKRWLLEYWKCSWWMQKASETLISLVHVFAFLYVFISVSKVMSMIMFSLSLFFWSCRHLFLGTCCLLRT
jgi:hypothetical protein